MSGSFVRIALVLAAGAVSANAAHIFMTSSSDPNVDTLIRSTLQSFGHVVTVGPQQGNFDGTYSLAGYDAFLLLMSLNYSGNMPVAGQAELLQFVVAGGGLVTGEWTIWADGSRGAYSTLDGAFPVQPTTAYSYGSPITYTQGVPDSTLNAGLPGVFMFTADDVGGTETNFVAKAGATVYYTSSGSAGGAGVVGWHYHAGRVLNLSTLILTQEVQDQNYRRLLSNAFRWVAPIAPGDMNCDGAVNFGDINPFVLALSNPAGYVAQFPNCNIMNGDINGDGLVDFGDINPFVALLAGD